MKNSKRFWSLLLAGIMTLGVFPQPSAFAADGDNSAPAAMTVATGSDKTNFGKFYMDKGTLLSKNTQSTGASEKLVISSLSNMKPWTKHFSLWWIVGNEDTADGKKLILFSHENNDLGKKDFDEAGNTDYETSTLKGLIEADYEASGMSDVEKVTELTLPEYTGSGSKNVKVYNNKIVCEPFIEANRDAVWTKTPSSSKENYMKLFFSPERALGQMMSSLRIFI